MTAPTEWEFAADAASRMNETIQATSLVLPFSRAKVEQRSRGSLKRRDLTLLGHSGDVVLTGEIKMPWTDEGQSPFVETLARDARRKAQRANSRWFFTWNVRELILWETEPTHLQQGERFFQRFFIAPISNPSDFGNEYVENSLKEGIAKFLLDFARIVEGGEALRRRPPDDYFIESLESFLERPIQIAFWELSRQGADPRKQEAVKQWMVKEQGWTLSSDPVENWRRAAQFATYAVVNKLVFYEALRKRFPSLHVLRIPPHVSTGEQILEHLAAFFSRAQEVTRDYETVFGLDATDQGTRIPFYASDCVPSWRTLVEHVDRFDFSEIDYDVIGRIFERLIGPEERHRYGQYYTRPEVVDLINSFCIQSGATTVLDPACGGGTFLVRAYARKRKLAPHLDHAALISTIYGADISHFAAHLTTINLASRELIDAENYPRIVRENFFDLNARGRFMQLPAARATVHSLGRESVSLRLSEVDAVVANPPYVRQEDIASHKPGRGQRPRRGTKEFYRDLVERETGVKLSGRSDLHCYFWGHAASFLSPSGWLGFLTSSQWLDVEYGFKLQGWLLRNFRIVAILESRVEPWFVGARVATTVTIAQRESIAADRDENVVRFVELRAPLSRFLVGDGTSTGMIEAADRFRDELLMADRDRTEDDYRIRLVRQGDLHSDGVALGRLMQGRETDDETAEEEEERDDLVSGEYFGGKWGIHLRAPDIWFDLRDRTGRRWERLGALAVVRFGLKTGADKFFYMRDVTGQMLAEFAGREAFERHFGVLLAAVESGEVKLMRNGWGEVHPIESAYLEPEVHSLMEISGFTVSPEDCARMVLLVGRPKSELRGTHAGRYIDWGERQGAHLGATCAARVTVGDPDRGIRRRDWYDLTGTRRGRLFWMKSSQYKHVVPLNSEGLICNCNLYDVFPRNEVDPVCLSGILNSSVVVLSKYLYGRPVGVEGALKTEVIDVNMMAVPSPISAPSKQVKRIANTFQEMSRRQPLGFLSERRLRRMSLTQRGRQIELEGLSDESELDQPDRHELDDAVLELLGIEDPSDRVEIRTRLYACLREHFQTVRQKEEEAILNKKRAKRAGRLTADEIAEQIVNQIKEESPLFAKGYSDFLSQRMIEESDAKTLPTSGTAEVVDDMITTGVRFAVGRKKSVIVDARNVEQARLIALVSGVENHHRTLFFPRDAKAASELRKRFARHLKERKKRMRELVQDRTADPDFQDRVLEQVMLRLTG